MRKTSLFKALSLLFVLTLLPKLFFAVPAYPHPVEYQLPDGSVITILLKGDERVHWAQTIDGYTLMRNQDGFYEYAILDENGDLAASGIQAVDESERTAAETAFLSGIRKDLRYSAEQIGI
ncbi:hypothetical protein LJB78_01275, partial [Bacteroidales bacterium OttesenSCG-928-J16]|nr:hypothetical protein [Bacteroidales bacterium OttesenSCG-928-J16]